MKTLARYLWENWFIIIAWALVLVSVVAEDSGGIALGAFFAVVHYGQKKSVTHLTINVKSNVDSDWTVSTEPANEKESP